MYFNNPWHSVDSLMVMIVQRLKRQFVALIACILISIPDVGFASTTVTNTMSYSASNTTSTMQAVSSPSASEMTSMTHMMSSLSTSDMTSNVHMAPSTSASDSTSMMHAVSSLSASDMTSNVHMALSTSASDTTSMMHAMSSLSTSDMTSNVHMALSTSATDTTSMMHAASSSSASDMSSMTHIMSSSTASDMSSVMRLMSSPSTTDTTAMMAVMPSSSGSKMAPMATSSIPTVTPKPTCPPGFTGGDCLTKTPTQTFAATMRLNQQYDDAYDDINSAKSLALRAVLKEVFEPFFRKRFPDFMAIIFKRFFEGSVGVDYELIFPTTSNVTDNNIVQALKAGNGTEELGFLNLTGDVTVTKQVVQTTAAPTGLTGKSTIKEWEIVLIAAAAIIFFLIVAICVLAIKYRNAIRDDKQDLYALDGNWEVMENGHNGLRAHHDYKSRNAPQSYASPIYGKVPGSDNKAYQEDSAL